MILADGLSKIPTDTRILPDCWDHEFMAGLMDAMTGLRNQRLELEKLHKESEG